MGNTSISNKAKVRVIWEEIPENYSKQSEKQIAELFSKKYGVDKKNIKVLFSPIKIDESGNRVKLSDSGLENVMDQNYQRDLMVKWLKLTDKKVDFERLMGLDDKVNAALNYDYESSFNKRWSLKWVAIDNFLSFGSKNLVDLTKYKGFNFVCSNPPNQGGKTTFTVDAIMFLLFGNTTKTDVNGEIFNTFTNKDTVVVRGMIEFEGKEMIIERKLSRKLKDDGDYTITSKLSYFQLLPDGEEVKLNAEETKSTTNEIRNIVGLESDFEIVVCATGDNLENSIKGTAGQRGSLITRFIGLEPIMEKEKIVRKMYNDYSKTLKGNVYNVVELIDEVSTHESNINMCDTIIEKHKKSKEEAIIKGSELKNKRDEILSGKIKIKDELITINKDELDNEIDDIISKGKDISNNIAEFEVKIKTLSEIKFDEDEFDKISKEKFDLELKIKQSNSDKNILESEIKNLKNAEFCITCNGPLKDVDNSKQIKEKEEALSKTITNIAELETNLKTKSDYIEKNRDNKDKVKERDVLELNRDRLEVEIGRLRNIIKEKRNVKKEYELNIEAISLNKNIDIEISKIDTDIVVNNTTLDTLTKQIEIVKNDKENNLKEKVNKNKLIKEIKAEEEVLRLYKIYIEMIGKKGISKLILRSVLPIINAELFRLMDEICDFTLEMNINNRNEVDYYIVKDDIKKSVKSGSGLERTISALSVRVVLGRLTTLPTPNFIVFDEILGKVASTNIEKMKLFFDKITEMYDSIFFISHNELVKDWSDNIINVEKEGNISRIN